MISFHREGPTLPGRSSHLADHPHIKGYVRVRGSIWPRRKCRYIVPPESSLKAQDPPDIAQVNGSSVGTLLSGQWGERTRTADFYVAKL